MAPSIKSVTQRSDTDAMSRLNLIVESWTQGFNTGAIIILMLIVLCNYRKGVVLHKLILTEVSETGYRLPISSELTIG